MTDAPKELARALAGTGMTPAEVFRAVIDEHGADQAFNLARSAFPRTLSPQEERDLYAAFETSLKNEAPDC